MEDAQKATESWAASAVQVARSRGFEQVDLDDLLQGEPEAAVRTGLDCVRTASGLLSDGGVTGLRVFLVVPSAPTTRLELEPTGISSLLDQPWFFGPGHSVPGLVVARLDNLHRDRVEQEYRRQVPMPIPDWYAEYRTWRTPEQAAAGWEYDRATYFWLHA